MDRVSAFCGFSVWAARGLNPGSGCLREALGLSTSSSFRRGEKQGALGQGGSQLQV